jgi:predicted AAA+ superfamily ATPase
LEENKKLDKIKRILNINLPDKQSTFLWGPRKTGKSTYINDKFADSIVYDFLKTDLFFEFTKRPGLLSEQLLAEDENRLKYPIIIDEVQKIPQILDEVHWLIENKGIRFILCGSSARKLKRGKANLLGGRAWRYEMFPFVFKELIDFNLLRALNHGLIPVHYLNNNYQKSIKAYVQDYLKEEIFAEGLSRNIPAFSRFFDAIGFTHGELTNYVNIARECGVNSKTVKEYYQILVDTLIGTFVEPFTKHPGRQIITKAPKFYLFDVGVANYLAKRKILDIKGSLFGKAFEHFIFTEILAYRSYHDMDFNINFWRTKSGIEVDFILNDGEIAVEVKGSSRIDKRELYSLIAFTEEYSPRKTILVCTEKEERIVNKIHVIPWQKFLHLLWDGAIL